jgi:hypothetical protein
VHDLPPRHADVTPDDVNDVDIHAQRSALVALANAGRTAPAQADALLRAVPDDVEATAVAVVAGASAARAWPTLKAALQTDALTPWLHVAAVDAALQAGAFLDEQWLVRAQVRFQQLEGDTACTRERAMLGSAIGQTLRRRHATAAAAYLAVSAKGWPRLQGSLPHAPAVPDDGPSDSEIWGKRLIYVVFVVLAGMLWKLATLAPHMAHGGGGP